MASKAGSDMLDLLLDSASPSGLDAARRRVLAHLKRDAAFDHDARRVYALELVLEEWLTNAFGHGGASQVRVKASHDTEGLLLIQFEDDGVLFDATAQAPTARPASLDEAEPGGLGLMLIQRYAKRWTHGRENGRNLMRVWL